MLNCCFSPSLSIFLKALEEILFFYVLIRKISNNFSSRMDLVCLTFVTLANSESEGSGELWPRGVEAMSNTSI